MRGAEFPVRLYGSPDCVRAHGAPSTPKEVLKHQAVMVGTETWKFSDGVRTTPVAAQGRLKADSALGLAEAVAAGLGIGVFGDLIAEPYVAAGKLIALMPGYTLPPVGMFVVRPPSEHSSRKVKLLTEYLIKHFGHS